MAGNKIQPPPLGRQAALAAKSEADLWAENYATQYDKWSTANSEAQTQYDRGELWPAAATWRKAASTPTPQPLAVTDDLTVLTNVRAVAKEWLAAALTLFGLFSFTTIFFGQDALNQLDGHPFLIVFFLISAVLAVAAATLAIGVGTRAAHGWPKGQRSHRAGKLIGSPATARTNGDDTAKTVECARDDLKSSVAFAGATLVFTVLAVGTVVIAHLRGPGPVPQEVDLLNASGKRVACGLVTGVRVVDDGNKDNGEELQIGVTPEGDGVVTWYDLDSVAKYQVRDCPR